MSRAGPGASPKRDRRTPPARVGRRPRVTAAGAAVLGALRDPVVDVFLLAGTFDVLSGDRVVDGVVLFGVAAALGRDAGRRPRGEGSGATVTGPGGEGPSQRADSEPAPPGWGPATLRLSPAVVLGGLLYALLAARFTRYSWPATVAVAMPAATAVAVARRQPPDDHAGPRRLPVAGLVAWAAVFVALGLWELTALLLQPSLTTDSYVHPTISVLMDPVLAGYVGRAAFLSLWLATGWYLLRR